MLDDAWRRGISLVAKYKKKKRASDRFPFSLFFLFLPRKAINPYLSALVSPADRCVSSPPQMGSTLTRPEEDEEEEEEEEER